MKPEVFKQKNARGRITGYTAYLGAVRGDGETPQSAVAACEANAQAAIDRLDKGSRILSWHEHTAAVSPSVEGWEYWLDTFTRNTYACQVPGSLEKAIDSALSHLGQNVWTHDIADDAAFVSERCSDGTRLSDNAQAELSRWIRFQRSYAECVARGMSDTEAHRAAHS